MRQCPRIALTGGPGGGKTRLLRELRARDPSGQRFLGVPEAATLLLKAGMAQGEKAFQLGIVRVQLALEQAVTDAAGSRHIVVCDRGTVDSLAYWTLNGWDQAEIFSLTGLTLAQHLTRYDGIIHLQTTAIGAQSHYRRNGDVRRSEKISQAAQIDAEIGRVCSKHPHYHLVENAGRDWAAKSQAARSLLANWTR